METEASRFGWNEVLTVFRWISLTVKCWHHWGHRNHSQLMRMRGKEKNWMSKVENSNEERQWESLRWDKTLTDHSNILTLSLYYIDLKDPLKNVEKKSWRHFSSRVLHGKNVARFGKKVARLAPVISIELVPLRKFIYMTKTGLERSRRNFQADWNRP